MAREYTMNKHNLKDFKDTLLTFTLRPGPSLHSHHLPICQLIDAAGALASHFPKSCLELGLLWRSALQHVILLIWSTSAGV